MKRLLPLVAFTPNGSSTGFKRKQSYFGTIRNKSFLLAFTILLMFAQSHAQNVWNGGGANNWSTTGNWSLGHIPTAGEDVIVPNNRTLNINVANAVCKSLTISGGGNANTVTITGTNTITITGALSIGAGTGSGDNKIFNIAGGTLTVSSINIAESGNDNRRSEVSVSTGTVNVSGDINMDGSSVRNFFRFTGNGTLNLGGDFTGINRGILIPATGTVNLNGATPQTISGANTSSFYNLVINKSSASDVVSSTGNAFAVANNLTVTSGALSLEASNADYTVANDVTVAANGTITHKVNWDLTGRLFRISGSCNITGIFNYTVRSHVQMNGTANENVSTGADPTSAFCILTLRTGNFYATGDVRVNDNFWAMFGTGGSFHTNNRAVYANGAVANNGGTIFIDGGSLTVTGGLTAGSGMAGTVNLSAGTLETDGITIGSGAAGSFIHSGGINNINGNLIISTGSYTCSNSPAINISGNWTNNLNAAAFVPASSTVTFNNTGASQFIDGSAVSQTFGNILVNNAGQLLSVSGSTSAITVNNGLTLNAGSFAAGTAANISIAGNWTNNGGVFNGGSGTVTFNGSVLQSIGGSIITIFNNISLNNTSGLSLPSVDVQVSGAAGALNFTNGKIITGSHKMSLGTLATITGAGANTYVYGNLQMGVATGSPSRFFAVGDATTYAPVSVIFNGVTTAGNVTANTVGSEHPSILSSTIDESKSVNRYWNLSNAGTVLTSYTVTFNFLPGDIDAGATPANFIIARRSGSWAYPTIGTRNPTNTTATLSSFGEYAIGEGGAAVPVISAQPADQVVCGGSTATFTAVASNKPASVVSWMISTDGGFTYNPLTIVAPYSVSTSTAGGLTTSVLTVNPVTASLDAYQYKATFTNSRGSVTSADPYIDVLPTATANAGAALPNICGIAASVPLGGSIGGAATSGTWSTPSGGTFSPNANTLNATWTPPVGFTGTATLTLTATGGSCGSATASKTQLVNAAAPAVTITPASASICNNGIQMLKATNGTAATAASGTVNLSIPNNSSTGVASTLNIASIPSGSDIYEVVVTFNVTHPEVADLIMNLRSPNGNVINLANRPSGGAGTNFTNTVVSSAGTTAFSSGSSPFTATFRADATNGIGANGQVSNTTSFASLFSGGNGSWTLSARDAAFANTGTLVSWSIALHYTQPITWTPVSALYTDAAATIPYTAGLNSNVVYAKPSIPGNNIFTATATNGGGCTSSQDVTIAAGPVVTITTDYCYGGGKIQLTAVSNPVATSWLWNTGATTQSILVDLAGLYQVTATTSGGCVGAAAASIAQELVVNGDFSAGNTGFASSYSYVNPTVANGMYPEATYTINENPTFNHNMFFGRDHTSNTGKLMIINGAGSPVSVWQQTLNVQPSTTYYFSAWAISLNNAAPFAQLQFDVNGSAVGTTAVLAAGPSNNNPPYNWVRFYGNWTSGPSTTTAVVSIKDLQTALGGNDFGLDDISFGTLSTFITHTSAPGSDSQTVCKNTPMMTNTYNIGGGVAGPIVTGLPAGVTGSFNGVSLTISGTPTSVGTFNYTITTTGTCNPVTANGRIIVTEDSIIQTSAAGTETQSGCLNSAITPVTYNIRGAATGANVTGLPAGVSYAFNAGVLTISGTPTTAGAFNFTVSTTGGCAPVSVNGSLLIRRQIITRSSPAGTNAQTLCINTPITNITYSVGGTATGATVTGLPAGVTGVYAAGVVTISGTPTVGGSFSYVVTTSGTCLPVIAAGTITVNHQSITLSSAPGTNNQAVCVNTPMVDISYTLTGSTGASVTGLPPGINGIYSAGSYAISGIPTATGTFNYTVTTTGTCTPVAAASGTITVSQQTITLSSGAGTNNQTRCINTAISNITFNVGGTATNASATGLPAGVSGIYNAGVFTISGTPTVSGTFNYTVSSSGSCSPVATATGTITVTVQTITLTSGAGTNNQTRCRGTALSNITFNVGGTATSASAVGLPAGVAGVYNAGVFTISGSATVAGVYNYTVTTSGSCNAVTATGTLTINRQTIALSSAAGTNAQALCVNTAITPITYAVGGSATGAAAVGLPAGVSGVYNAGAYTITGSPSVAGTFNYTVTTSGTCTNAVATGTITVSATPSGGTIANVSTCFNGGGNMVLSGNVGTVVRWESSADGIAWTNIANTTTTQLFAAATQTMRYRALVQNGTCASTVYSNIGVLGIHNLWTGEVSSDWNNNSNWSDGQAPTTSCPDVTIPVLTAPNVYPQLTSGSTSINNLIIHSSATMVVANATLQVAGSISNAGTLDITSGTLQLNGASAQSIAGSYFSGHTIHNLVVSNSNGVSFLNSNDTVKVTGLLSVTANNAVLNTNNNLTLVSNAAGTASVGDLTNGGTISGADISGNVTVERYIPQHPKSWQFLSTPTTGQSIKDAWQEGNSPLANNRPGYGTIITGHMAGAVGLGFDIYTPTGPSMKVYNSTNNTWDGVASVTMPIANAKGYMFFVRGDRSVTAYNQAANATTLRTTGKLYTFGANAPASSSVPPGKLQSIGNPYASAIDFRLISKPAAPAVDDAFYVWDPLLTNNYNGLGGYQTITAANGWKPIPGGTANYDVNVAYPYIQSGQAFLVHATGAGGTVAFSESNKVINTATVNRDNELSSRQFFRVSLYNATNMLADGNVVAFDDSFTNGYTSDDALKVANSAENINIVSNGKLLALEARAPVTTSDTVYYNFSNIRRAAYTLRFSPDNMSSSVEALLVDKFLNVTTAISLTDTSRYDFAITNDAGSWAGDRFYVVFKRAMPVTISNFTVTPAASTVVANWTVQHESNVQYYAVERSVDGTNFSNVRLADPSGNNCSTVSYVGVDNSPLRGTSYYRIRGVKTNGQEFFSQVIRLSSVKTLMRNGEKNLPNTTPSAQKQEFSIFPNPVVGNLINLNYNTQAGGMYHLELYNSSGQLFQSFILDLKAGSRVEQLAVRPGLNPGIYQLQIKKPGTASTSLPVMIK